ncbi:MAG: acyl-CoA dehydrogenase family protein [Chthoniobacterales bacterium]
MNSFFQKLTDFLEEEVAPRAHRLDEEEVIFREVYDRFVKLGGLYLLIPRDLGGLGGERREWIEYNVLMAQYSGALLFLQAQHQFCISRLKKLLPHAGVEELFRFLSSKNQGIGLALQKNKNLLRVEKTVEGYRLSGTFLWATGHGFFPRLLVSFEHEETLFYTLIPFGEAEKEGGSIRLSSKIETIVFNAVPSHRLILDRWFITKNDLLAMHPVLPKTPVEHPSIYNMAGVSKALLHLTLQGQYGSTPEVLENHEVLQKRWNGYYQQILEGSHDPLIMRVTGLRLAEESALLARFACGAASILKEHPINRLIREIWQYTVAGYSEEQRQAYLRNF